MPVYLDDNGNPIAGKTYLDEHGNPVGQKGPQLRADPGPGISARHEDTREPSGTLMDLIPPASRRRADMHAYENSLPLAVPGVVGDVRKVPGIIAQVAKLPATKAIAKQAGKFALKRAAEGAGAGTAYALWRKIFD